MGFSEAIKSTVMAKCGRHCCLCRRFRPTHLQIHHIQPAADGGSDTVDNAIPICLTCHSDIHTHRPFAQRFSRNELVSHRERVYRLVEDGKLVAPEDTSDLTAHRRFESVVCGHQELSRLSQEILCAAATGGEVSIDEVFGGLLLKAGTILREIPCGREVAEINDAIRNLERQRLIQRVMSSIGERFQVTLAGYNLFDDLQALAFQQQSEAIASGSNG